MKKRLFTLALALLLCLSILPMAALAEESDHRPINVSVSIKGVTTENGRKWLVTEVSWDADTTVHEGELYAHIKNAAGNKYDIPDRSAFTIGDSDGFPDEFKWRTKNGRNIMPLKLPYVGEGEEQFSTSSYSGETYANGIQVGDMVGVELQSAGQGSSGEWFYSELSDPVYMEVKEDGAVVIGGSECEHAKTTPNHDDEKHWDECNQCHKRLNEAPHTANKWNHNTKYHAHWKECACGWIDTATVEDCTPGTAVRENEVAAATTADGSYDEVVYCTVCQGELSRETVVVLMLTGEINITQEPESMSVNEGGNGLFQSGS